MIKAFNRTLVLAAASACLLATTIPAQAASPSKSELEQMKMQVQMLIQQNQQLSQRITEMEKNVQQPPPAKAAIEEEVSRQLSEKKAGPQINDFVSLSGSIEGDYKLSQAKDGANTSEFILDTVELIMDVQLTDWATGKIVIDYDGDDDDRFYLDEANITLGKTEDIPFFLTAGKIYVPFGDFSTNMIQDPLTQTLGEINPKGVIVGYEAMGLTAAVFSYNGMDEGDDDNDTINGFGASLGYAYEQEDVGFNVGIAWVSNIGDSSTITDVINDNGFDSISDEVAGINLNIGGQYKAFSAIAEYTAALDSFDASEVPYGTGAAEPKALNTELAYSTSIMEKDTVFALGYQRSWEAYALDLPEHRYIASASMNIIKGTTVNLEYYVDEFYANDPDAGEDSGYGFTTRLMYEF
ncbi:MAG: LbtU family siderophore porin [Desulfobulbus sp.]|nr:LbtU family siderophore porin [Desulfobulbus sp.]